MLPNAPKGPEAPGTIIRKESLMGVEHNLDNLVDTLK